MWKPVWNKKESSDPKLFEEQIHLIYKDLYRYIYGIVRNPVLAEDVLQNTLEKAYKSMSTFQGRSKFKTWVYTIARNESLTLLCKFKRENLVENAALDRCPTEEPLLPEQYVIDSEMRERVIESINQLKPEFRDIIILRYYAELSMEEMAAALNININTVKSRHMRAKEKIARIMQAGDAAEAEGNINLVRGVK